jgi:hypothetical protein
MYITRALIGRNPCLNQAIQTRKTSCCCYFIKQLLYGFRVWMASSKHLGMLLELRKGRKITRLRLVFRAFFLSKAIQIRPSKDGNHKVIVYQESQYNDLIEPAVNKSTEWVRWSSDRA